MIVNCELAAEVLSRPLGRLGHGAQRSCPSVVRTARPRCPPELAESSRPHDSAPLPVNSQLPTHNFRAACPNRPSHDSAPLPVNSQLNSQLTISGRPAQTVLRTTRPRC